MEPLTFGSLFAGIGGIDLGLERAGMVCKFQVEIDDYATRVLVKHWPDVPRFRDVRECGAHNLPRVDLIAGGFPCQDISNAGRRAGIDGERSGLWREFARIIGELRPRYILVENVPALLVRGMGRVLGDLSALGYDAEWQCVPAAAVGAPHIRDRIFILAYANSIERGPITEERHLSGRANARGQEASDRPTVRGTNGRATVLADAACLRWKQGQREEAGRGILRHRGSRSGDGGLVYFDHYETEPGMGRMVDGVPARVDRLRGLGNAVVPQVAEFIGRCIMEATCPTPQPPN